MQGETFLLASYQQYVLLCCSGDRQNNKLQFSWKLTVQSLRIPDTETYLTPVQKLSINRISQFPKQAFLLSNWMRG